MDKILEWLDKNKDYIINISYNDMYLYSYNLTLISNKKNLKISRIISVEQSVQVNCHNDIFISALNKMKRKLESADE